MIEPDSQKQEKRLNCKIIAGKVRISNVDDFLSVLETIARKYSVIIQALDAELIAGEEHIISAVKKAIRAVARKKSITSDLGLEILLYAAGKRQIERALRIGVSESEGESEKKVAVVIVDTGVGVGVEKDLEVVAEEVKRKAMIKEELMSELELELELERDRGRREKIKNFFDITEAEIKAVGEKKLKMLVLERVAMLDVLK